MLRSSVFPVCGSVILDALLCMASFKVPRGLVRELLHGPPASSSTDGDAMTSHRFLVVLACGSWLEFCFNYLRACFLVDLKAPQRSQQVWYPALARRKANNQISLGQARGRRNYDSAGAIAGAVGSMLQCMLAESVPFPRPHLCAGLPVATISRFPFTTQALVHSELAGILEILVRHRNATPAARQHGPGRAAAANLSLFSQ